ncbi:cadherin-like domain-containing protein [Vibrio lentus]|nr:cadherin-like domain-containing protein [Vibrio lentus]
MVTFRTERDRISASDTVDVTDNGDGTYTLTPEQGFFGNVDLTFDVSDGTDVVAANIDLKVEFVNDAPEATPMVADVDEDGSILVTQTDVAGERE